MVLNNIDKLVEKYEKGETTLQEEQSLRDYFSKDNIEPHLEVYKPMFTYFTQTKSEQFTKEIFIKPKSSDTYKWVAVAASIMIMLGIFFNPFSGPSDLEQREALLAYNETMQAFSMVSNQINQGKEKLSPLNVLNTNLTEGMHKANLIKEFSETTSIVYNPSNN